MITFFLSVIIVSNTCSQTALWQPVSSHYIKEETEVHLFVPANSSETVKGLLHKGAITHEYVAGHKAELCNELRAFGSYLYVCFRVLLSNANELIEMQTRNYSTDPRSSSSFYERYHNLEDVCFSFFNCWIPSYNITLTFLLILRQQTVLQYRIIGVLLMRCISSQYDCYVTVDIQTLCLRCRSFIG